jgi:hypothetical protein
MIPNTTGRRVLAGSAALVAAAVAAWAVVALAQATLFSRAGAATTASIDQSTLNRIDQNAAQLCAQLSAAGYPCTASTLTAQADKVDQNAYNACVAANKLLIEKKKATVTCVQKPVATTAPPTTAPPTTASPTPTTAGFPGAANTGIPAGTALRPYPGPWTITTPNTVLSGYDFTGGNTLLIRAAGVVIKNSKIENNSDNGYLVSMDDKYPTATLAISDSEFIGSGGDINYDQLAIRGSGWSMLRVKAHNFENIGGDDGNNVIQDSYFYGWPASNPTCDHLDGFQSLGGTDNVTIKHNTIIMEPTNCITAPIHFGTEYGYGGHNVTVDDNYLAGGARVIYCGDNVKTVAGVLVTDSNFKITNNHFGKDTFPTYGQYGVSDHCGTGTGVTWTGNVDATTGAAVPVNF